MENDTGTSPARFQCESPNFHVVGKTTVANREEAESNPREIPDWTKLAATDDWANFEESFVKRKEAENNKRK